MVFEYIPGGELFSYLRNVRRFSNSITRFYCSEIVLALEYLHSLNIVSFFKIIDKIILPSFFPNR